MNSAHAHNFHPTMLSVEQQIIWHEAAEIAAVWKAAEDMEHVEPEERERMKREMGAFLDVMAEKPYVGLRKMREHRSGGLRLWPKWKSVRKIWYEEKESKEKSWGESAEDVREEIEEGISKKMNKE